MVSFLKAAHEDIPELKRLWLLCFDEAPQAAELFFERTKYFLHAYKAVFEGKIIAAVYLVDCSLNGRRAHYLCGAATRPDFRGRGIMSGLVGFALSNAESKGDICSALLPADEGLYGFYKGLGYESLCEVKRLTLTREELGEYRPSDSIFPDTDSLQKLCFQNNFLLWNKELLRFAIDYYAVYGIKTVFSSDALVIAEVENGTAEVIYAVYRDFDSLKSLLFKIKADRYTLTLKGGDIPYGMLKPLGGNQAPDNLFIGITLS